MFIVGILGSLISKSPDSSGRDTLEQSIRQWTNIDPEIMLFVFLPPLVFGESMVSRVLCIFLELYACKARRLVERIA
jgi:hypothetical protein